MVASTRDWLPSRIADRVAMFRNFRDKFPGYQAVLGLTAAQIAHGVLLCDTYIAANTYTEQYRAGNDGTLGWRDNISNGPVGQPVGDPPAPPVNNMPAGATTGVIAQFRELRDIILAAPGYTGAIGEDLMIAPNSGISGPKVPIDEAAPDLKVTVGTGYEVNLAGAMHGMDAMRIEWQPNGSDTWSLVGFLTRTPGHVIISPQTPGQPESGRIRARYIHNNNPVGNYSNNYAVTVSA